MGYLPYIHCCRMSSINRISKTTWTSSHWSNSGLPPSFFLQDDRSFGNSHYSGLFNIIVPYVVSVCLCEPSVETVTAAIFCNSLCLGILKIHLGGEINCWWKWDAILVCICLGERGCLGYSLLRFPSAPGFTSPWRFLAGNIGSKAWRLESLAVRNGMKRGALTRGLP